jgi:DNA-binding response OmpR family regulator
MIVNDEPGSQKLRQNQAMASAAGVSSSYDHSILLIDDDVELCGLMKEFFAAQRLYVEAVHDGLRGLSAALAQQHDLVLLDYMLPGLDGRDVLRQLRRRSGIPVIVLTAVDEPGARVAGLDGGADDYLAKPFGPDELLARIRAVLRRTTATPRRQDRTTAGPIALDAASREAWIDSAKLELTPTEFDLLEHLVRHAGRVVSREELMAVGCQREASPMDRALDVHVSHLRRKLGPRRTRLRTVRGSGYLLSPSMDPPVC